MRIRLLLLGAVVVTVLFLFFVAGFDPRNPGAAKGGSISPFVLEEPASHNLEPPLGPATSGSAETVKENLRGNPTEAAAVYDGPGEFDYLISRFRTQSDPEVLAELARLLAPHCAAGGARVEAELLDLARDGSLSARSTAALSLLSSLKNPSSEAVATVARISRGEASSGVRLNAIYTLGHWAENPALLDLVSGELVTTIDASEKPEVRGSAIQAIALHGGAATDAVLAAMVDYLEHDPTPKNRAIAALALGQAPPELRPSALVHLEAAFAAEPDLEIRRNIMTQIARAGEADAIPVLLQLPTEHPLLEQDVIDYVELLSSGEIDPDEIYRHKFALDAERGTIVGASTHRD